MISFLVFLTEINRRYLGFEDRKGTAPTHGLLVLRYDGFDHTDEGLPLASLQ